MQQNPDQHFPVSRCGWITNWTMLKTAQLSVLNSFCPVYGQINHLFLLMAICLRLSLTIKVQWLSSVGQPVITLAAIWSCLPDLSHPLVYFGKKSIWSISNVSSFLFVFCTGSFIRECVSQIGGQTCWVQAPEQSDVDFTVKHGLKDLQINLHWGPHRSVCCWSFSFFLFFFCPIAIFIYWRIKWPLHTWESAHIMNEKLF